MSGKNNRDIDNACVTVTVGCKMTVFKNFRLNNSSVLYNIRQVESNG